jgi:hypothetical protein
MAFIYSPDLHPLYPLLLHDDDAILFVSPHSPPPPPPPMPNDRNAPPPPQPQVNVPTSASIFSPM